jgi:hypothetical protein
MDEGDKNVFFRSKFSICWNLNIFSIFYSNWHRIIYCNFCKREGIIPDRKKMILLLPLYIHTIILWFTSCFRSFPITNVLKIGVAFSFWWVFLLWRQADDFRWCIVSQNIICILEVIRFLIIFCSFRSIWSIYILSSIFLRFSDGLNLPYWHPRNLKIIDWDIGAAFHRQQHLLCMLSFGFGFILHRNLEIMRSFLHRGVCPSLICFIEMINIYYQPQFFGSLDKKTNQICTFSLIFLSKSSKWMLLLDFRIKKVDRINSFIYFIWIIW